MEPLSQEGAGEKKGPFLLSGIGGVSLVAAAVLGAVIGVLVGGSGSEKSPSPSPAPAPAETALCRPPGSTEASCPYNTVNDLNGDNTHTLSGTPYPKPASEGVVRAPRIEYEVVTVDDLDMALTFYTEVLGATAAEFPCDEPPCRIVKFHGDAHKRALFNMEGSSEQIPDIGDDGEYEVRSAFVVLGNGMIQFMQFAKRTDGSFFDLRERRTSPCWVGGGHIDFWIADSLDMNDYIFEVEEKAKAMNMPNVAWNRPVPQTSRADRAKIPKEQYANKVPDGSGSFSGLEWSYFKGPVGEQLELYKVTSTIKESFGRNYCDRGAVCSAFQADAGENSAKPISQQNLGIFQFGYRTADLHRAVGFYTEVLGGSLMTYPTHGLNIRGDDSHWMILANETIEAFELAAKDGLEVPDALTQLGVANISTAGGMRLDHRFILFDNFVVEPLLYTNGLAFGGQAFNPEWDHSTNPAYIGTVGAAFGLVGSAGNTDIDLASTLEQLKTRASSRGYSYVKIPSASDVASFGDGHPYQGLSYTYGKGESGEVLIYVSIGGPFEEVVKSTFKKAGGVSTRFPETDIFRNGKMKGFCDSLK